MTRTITKKRQVAIGLAVPLLFAALLGLVKFFQIRAAIAEGAANQPPPETVTTFVVEKRPWPVTVDSVGTVRSLSSTILSAEQSGRVKDITVEPGALVDAGTPLVQLDTEVERAELQGAKAERELAQLNFTRQEALAAKKANAPSDLDAARAALRQAEAEVLRLQSLIERRIIAAPFSGRVGVPQVQVGEWVDPGRAVVDIASQEDVIVDFTLPESVAPRVKSGQPVSVLVDSGDKQLTFAGEIISRSSVADPKTRTINVRASLDVTLDTVPSGIFASVRVTLSSGSERTVIPLTAVQFAPFGDTVYVIQRDAQSETAMANAKIVELGEKRGDYVVVLAGLEVGDEVVSSGTFKIRSGSPVRINNSRVALPLQIHPNPEDA